MASVSSFLYPQQTVGPRSAPALVVVPAEAPDQEFDVHDAEVSGLLTQQVGLTARDVVVLRYLSEGWTTAAIARELAYAESTIKKEVHLIVHRLGARNRTHAVAKAVRGHVI